jgi:glycosyltransferase involved in cell wall biosynthesis
MSGLTASIVLPVAGPSRLLEDCLGAARGQRRPADELIVVDDSPDGNLEAVPGAKILRSAGRGPYAARNLGWRASTSEVVLFMDVRSRPLQDWTEQLLEAFADPAVALAGSEVRIAPGASIAAEASGRQQFFRLANYLEDPFFLPYLPTCNLAIRRSDLEAVGGFDEVRSGGDADVCWRILSQSDRRLEAIPSVLMDWVPRDRVRDYLEQNYRYGKSSYELRTRWEEAGAKKPAPWGYPRLSRRIVRTAGRALRNAALRRKDELVRDANTASLLAYELGYRIAADRVRRGGARRSSR